MGGPPQSTSRIRGLGFHLTVWSACPCTLLCISISRPRAVTDIFEPFFLLVACDCLLACGLSLQKDIVKELKRDFVEATSAWAVYQPMEAINAKMVRLLAERLEVSEVDANTKLMGRIKVPKRRNSRSSATMLAYRYLKRSVSHLFENLGKAAVKAFISSVNESTNMGHKVPVPNSTRTVLELSPADASYLFTGDRFIREIFGHMALLAAAKIMFASINATNRFTERNEQGIDTVVCLLAHMAFVVTKVREHLRLRMNGGVVQNVAQTPGVNEGHREPWIRELLTLDQVYWRRTEATNGLRLVDAASPTRALVISPAAEADAAAARAGGAGGLAGPAAGASGQPAEPPVAEQPAPVPGWPAAPVLVAETD